MFFEFFKIAKNEGIVQIHYVCAHSLYMNGFLQSQIYFEAPSQDSIEWCECNLRARYGKRLSLLFQILRYSGTRFQDDVVTALVGGLHTTGLLLTWLLYFFGKHPHIQALAREEVIRVGSPTSSHDVLKNYTFLHQCINETLRTRCLAPWAARINESELTLGEFTIPEKTPIILALFHFLRFFKIAKNEIHVF